MADLFDAWFNLGGSFSDLVPVKKADGALELFAIDPGGDVQHRWQQSPGGEWWPQWMPLGEQAGIATQVVAGRNLDGALEVFASTSDSNTNVRHTRQDSMQPSGWSPWTWFPGSGSMMPELQHLALGTNADGRLELFALCAEGFVYHIYQPTPGQWGDQRWERLSETQVRGPLRAAIDGQGRLQLFAISADDRLALICAVQRNPWDPWLPLPVDGASTLEVATNRDGRLEAFIVDGNKALWHVWQQGSGSSWSDAQFASIGNRLHDHLAAGPDLSGTLLAFAPRVGDAPSSDGVVDVVAQTNNWNEWRSLESREVEGQRFTRLRVIQDAFGRLMLFALSQQGSVWWIKQSSSAVYTNLVRIVANVAPIVYLHPEEKYKPSTVEFYLQNVQYVTQAGGVAGPPVTSANLPMGPAGAGDYLRIPSSNDWIMGGNLPNAKAYAHVLAFSQGGGGYDIQYFFFYPYNGHASVKIQLASASKNIDLPFGAHQGDWESVIVRVDLAGKVVGMYCNQHGDGTWYLPGDYQTIGQQPVIYSALNGHPSYTAVGSFPTAGATLDYTVPVIGRFALCLDNSTQRGDRWDCAAQHEIVEITGVPGITVASPWWLDFEGRYGNVAMTEEQRREARRTFEIVLEGFGFPKFFADEVANLYFAVLMKWYDLKVPDGPTAPKGKSWWNQVIPNGPWPKG